MWLAFLVAGTIGYWVFGRNAWYFQLRARGVSAEEAVREARAAGQELFPAKTTIESLRISARVWQTWALVGVYFTSFGGFVTLTSWLPTYWTSAFAIGVVGAGLLTAMYSLTVSGMRIAGGVLADSLYEGGQNAGILSLLVMLTGALVMSTALTFELAVPGALLLAIGMGICNAAVFKIVPQVVPQAVGGAAGWVGGLGAFGGFAIPPDDGIRRSRTARLFDRVHRVRVPRAGVAGVDVDRQVRSRRRSAETDSAAGPGDIIVVGGAAGTASPVDRRRLD